MKDLKSPKQSWEGQGGAGKTGRITLPDLQTILQSYSNQNDVVLVQKQTYISMKQNREPRNKSIYFRSINL